MEAATAEKDKTGAPANGAGGEQKEPLDGEHGDEAKGGEAKAEKPADPKLELQGKGQLSLKIGGPAPNKATAKIVGGKIEIPEGEYEPGEVIEVVARIQCTKVSITDKMNNGERTEREREHQFKLRQIEKVDA